MKILVAVKRVANSTGKVRVKANGRGGEFAKLKMS